MDIDDGTASLKLALRVASYFELGDGKAHQTAAQVGQVVATWRREANKPGKISPSQSSPLIRRTHRFLHPQFNLRLNSAALTAPAKYPSPAHPAWNIRLAALRPGFTHCGGEPTKFDGGGR